jgi:hypothetical protein
MQAEDVSEQLTTIEETILKLAEQEKLRLAKAEKLDDYTCCEQLRLFYLKKKRNRNHNISGQFDPKIVLFSYLKSKNSN